ncbi:uncharacterized protein [Triticum aestivum]|uniref:uncharacterized protein n=1 Tax=Triticum aestivum TaxID=4565 RepID=UPI001D02B3E1|nr:uncharacterized protein LOC123065705 [Triticum aestivum]
MAALVGVMALAFAGLVPLRSLAYLARKCGKKDLAPRRDHLADDAACCFMWAFNQLRSILGYGGNGGGVADGEHKCSDCLLPRRQHGDREPSSRFPMRWRFSQVKQKQETPGEGVSVRTQDSEEMK